MLKVEIGKQQSERNGSIGKSQCVMMFDGTREGDETTNNDDKPVLKRREETDAENIVKRRIDPSRSSPEDYEHGEEEPGL